MRDRPCQPAGTGDRARLLSKLLSFPCALFERAAHLRRNLRHFPECALFKTRALFACRAHLRSRASALHPVPFSRKVLQALVSASLDKLEGHNPTKGQKDTAQQKRAAPLFQARLRLGEIDSFWLYRILLTLLSAMRSSRSIAKLSSTLPRAGGHRLGNIDFRLNPKSIQCSCLISPEKLLLPIVALDRRLEIFLILDVAFDIGVVGQLEPRCRALRVAGIRHGQNVEGLSLTVDGQFERDFLRVDRRGLFGGRVEKIDRELGRFGVKDHLGVIFLFAQLDEMPAVRTVLMLVGRRLTATPFVTG